MQQRTCQPAEKAFAGGAQEQRQVAQRRRQQAPQPPQARHEDHAVITSLGKAQAWIQDEPPGLDACRQGTLAWAAAYVGSTVLLLGPGQILSPLA